VTFDPNTKPRYVTDEQWLAIRMLDMVPPYRILQAIFGEDDVSKIEVVDGVSFCTVRLDGR
jgi:hypothetical protein